MSVLLGIDIGTTTIKVSLIQADQLTVIEEHSEQPNAAVEIGTIDNKDEQDPIKILQTLNTLVAKFPLKHLQKVAGVSISGQMHGITLWSRTLRLNDLLQAQSSISSTSSLVTWRDGRCTKEFLATLPKSSRPISTGYGCCTLFWLNRYAPDVVQKFDHAGTVMDLAVFLLCQLDTVVMSDHNANSWGFFDIAYNQWETEILNNGRFPIHMLPEVVHAPCIAGTLAQSWHGIPSGVPVGVAMGDLQCSVYSVQPAHGEAVLNIGTASQICVTKPLQCEPNITYPPSVMEVPYFNGSNLIVAASLTGGNAFAAVADIFKEFLKYTSSSSISESDIYSILIKVGESKLNTTLESDPVLLGERHDPNKRGSVGNISTENVSLGDIVSSVLKGIAVNLESMMPKDTLANLKVTRLLGCGSALYNNCVLHAHIERVFGLELVMKCKADAPLGACIAMAATLTDTGLLTKQNE